jgi:hypothetical protein
VTNELGKYEFPLLPVGRYVVSAEAAGFERAITGEVVLNAGTEAKVDFKMALGQLTESVQVDATAPLVNATNSELGVVIDSQKIRELPLNGRDFTQFLALQPGWNIGTYAGGRGGVEINGTLGLGNNWLMMVLICPSAKTMVSVSERPTIAELRDHRILMYGRTELGRPFQSVSRDGGKSWSNPLAVDVASAYTPPLLVRIPFTHDLLLPGHRLLRRKLQMVWSGTAFLRRSQRMMGELVIFTT